MQVVFLGLPGAGKGTQAAAIRRDFGIPHVATGDMFRALDALTELGAQVKRYLNAGLMVPDELTIGLVQERLKQPDAQTGFLLDGFPRSTPQAQALDAMLSGEGRPITKVLYLMVGRDELLHRLTGRRVCSLCGATYHVAFNPPKSEGLCDRCGGPLAQRSDDRPETVAVRIEEQLSRMDDLLRYYDQQGILERINGEQSIAAVYEDIREALRGATA